jgi:hypothetical protein
MKKYVFLLIIINLFLGGTLTAQKNIVDSLLTEMLSNLTVLDTITVQIENMGLFRTVHAQSLEVHYKTDNGEKYKYIGPYKTYYRNGNLRSYAFYDFDGSRQGLKYEYYKNGTLRNLIDFGINKNHECCNFYGKWYDKNGLIDSEGQVQNGKSVGKWFFYNNGILDSYIDYSVAHRKKTKCNSKN